MVWDFSKTDDAASDSRSRRSSRRSSRTWTEGGDATPTHTAASDDMGSRPGINTTDDPNLGKPPAAAPEVVPWPGNTYVIREKEPSARAITIVNDELRLEDWNCTGDKSSHWICEEKEGWFGFRNPVYDRYMGHNNRGRFHAAVKHHRPWEYFDVRRHPDGGYLLLMRRWDTLVKIGTDADGRGLIETKDKGTLFEFLKL